MEPPENILHMCHEHASHPDPYWTTKSTKFFVGKYVKLGFPTKHPQMVVEHMWVEVKHAKKDSMIGVLSNDPIYCPDLKCGMMVEFTKDWIEVVMHNDEILIHE
jgi:uncharacterized protein YegJ (DUF2314 family)